MDKDYTEFTEAAGKTSGSASSSPIESQLFQPHNELKLCAQVLFGRSILTLAFLPEDRRILFATH